MKNNQKEIVFLINSMGEGGAQRILLNLVEEYLAVGLSVRVITLAKNELYQLPKEVTKFSLSGERRESSSLFETLLIPFYAWRLRSYLKRSELSIVQSHLFRANFVNILSGFFSPNRTVQVVNHSVISRFFKGGVSAKINLFLIQKLYPKAHKIFYISKRMQDDFVKNLKEVACKSVMIHNPYAIETIRQESQKEIDFMFDETKRYLITVGRLISLKRFEDILAVLSSLEENVELIMLGEGEEHISLERLANSLNIASRVHFLGQVANPFAYVARSTLFISTSSVEGFPNVLVESMICGTAIVSTDCISGPREILAPTSDHTYQLKSGLEIAEFGILYAVGDKEALKNSIEHLLENKDLKEGYEAKAFEQSLNFSSKKIALRYREEFFGLLES